jgi:hypothetical protein
MAEKKSDPTTALVSVMKALEPLGDPDRQWVLQSAANRWNLQVANINPGSGGGGTGAGATSAGGSGAGAANEQAAIAQKNARAFMRLKNPQTDVQRVACLGFYVLHTTNQPGFKSMDVQTANTDSGGTRINFTRALDNATRKAKYISSRGGNEKQLTRLGEDVVMALPDQEKVREVEAATRGRGKRGKRKKKA